MTYKFPETLSEANDWLERIGEKAKGYKFRKDKLGRYHIFNTDEHYGKSKYLFDLILVCIKEFNFKRDFPVPDNYKELFKDKKMKDIFFRKNI